MDYCFEPIYAQILYGWHDFFFIDFLDALVLFRVVKKC